MEREPWQDRPVVATTRVLLRLDRALVRAAVHEGSSPYGEPLWSSRWVLPVRRRDYSDLSAGSLWWVGAEAIHHRDPISFLTPREWADEMSRLRNLK